MHPVNLQPLSKQSDVEFVINSNGDAVLLHMGTLQKDFSWIQYDDNTGTLQFITEEGFIQELGFIIPELIKRSLDKTREISIIEIDNEFNCKKIELKVFNKVVH